MSISFPCCYSGTHALDLTLTLLGSNMYLHISIFSYRWLSCCRLLSRGSVHSRLGSEVSLSKDSQSRVHWWTSAGRIWAPKVFRRKPHLLRLCQETSQLWSVYWMDSRAASTGKRKLLTMLSNLNSRPSTGTTHWPSRSTWITPCS